MDAENSERKRIWIDLDNSPHIPFFDPIMKGLRALNYSLILTARDCFQVCGLADLYGLKYERIGVHYGKNKIMKAIGLMIRSAQLYPWVKRSSPDLAVSHGSRSQILLTALMRIPSVLIMDYEFAQKIAAPTWVLMPEVIPSPRFHFDEKRIIRYPGIKEDVYVPDFKPDPAIREELGLKNADIVATIRPPATEAHYHNPESEKLFSEVIRFLAETGKVTMVILPRNERQEESIRKDWPSLVLNGTIRIPEKVVNGLNLLWHSDLVISGGGTINREAAALGVPVYSIFRGKLGAIDHYLSRIGKLRLIQSIAEIRESIRIAPRGPVLAPAPENRATLKKIVESISEIAEGIAPHERNGGKSDVRGFIKRASYQGLHRRPRKDV